MVNPIQCSYLIIKCFHKLCKCDRSGRGKEKRKMAMLSLFLQILHYNLQRWRIVLIMILLLKIFKKSWNYLAYAPLKVYIRELFIGLFKDDFDALHCLCKFFCLELITCSHSYFSEWELPTRPDAPSLSRLILEDCWNNDTLKTSKMRSTLSLTTEVTLWKVVDMT